MTVGLGDNVGNAMLMVEPPVLARTYKNKLK